VRRSNEISIARSSDLSRRTSSRRGALDDLPARRERDRQVCRLQRDCVPICMRHRREEPRHHHHHPSHPKTVTQPKPLTAS
jgi:hypothetical protein